jgi:hypothetical protein
MRHQAIHVVFLAAIFFPLAAAEDEFEGLEIVKGIVYLLYFSF